MPVLSPSLLLPIAGFVFITSAARAWAQDSAPDAANALPAAAAGWGPELGKDRMASRWAEDWRRVPAPLRPDLKAIDLGAAGVLTLSGEARLRLDRWSSASPAPAGNLDQVLLRAMGGADWRPLPALRLYGELGSGQVHGRRASAAPNLQNALSLQQAFIEVDTEAAGAHSGLLLGRQEFSDGPRQLMSMGDGPNLHRSWNGVRAFTASGRWRIGAFSLRATRLLRGGLDEDTNDRERLRGLAGSVALRTTGAASAYLEPFWYRTSLPGFRAGGRVGADERVTLGARAWGRDGALRFDWTIAHQGGTSLQRPVDVWGLFAVNSVALGQGGWAPRLTSRLDVASGGGSYGSGKVRAFQQLYASSSYLGEGRFLSLSNLAMLTPGLAASPAPGASVAIEYGVARRLQQDDAVYGGGMAAYAGTQQRSGHAVGRLARLTGSWALTPTTTLFVNLEDWQAGALLRQNGQFSGRYLYAGASYRY